MYCGLQGWVSVLRKIVFYNDLAHPLSANLRNGHWASTTLSVDLITIAMKQESMKCRTGCVQGLIE